MKTRTHSHTHIHSLTGRLTLRLYAVLCIGAGLMSAPSRSGATVRWPTEWTVFAPMESGEELLDAFVPHDLPARLTVAATQVSPQRTLEPKRVAVVPGKPVDLAGVFGGESRAGQVAYVYILLQSETAQSVALGLGGDWWLESWLNGEPLLDTLAAGNDAFPPSVLDHQVQAEMHAGENLLVIRFIRGRASALLAVGDATHVPAAMDRRAERLEQRGLNVRPVALADRLIFPKETQATATAEWSIDLALPHLDPAESGIIGLQPMPERQVYLHVLSERRAEMRDTLEQAFEDPVTLLLSKTRYPYEDRHLEAMVWVTPPEGASRSGHLTVRLLNAAGETLMQDDIPKVSTTGWFFAVGLPQALAGSDGRLAVDWIVDERQQGSASAAFTVLPPAPVADHGRIPIRVLNAPGATLVNAPMTVGVPFSHGAFQDPARVRLVDETGTELPLQTRVSARWSRFGPVKWLLCDFNVDLDGEPREVFLEFAPPPAVAAALRAATDEDAAQGATAAALDIRRSTLDTLGETAHRAGLQQAAAHRAGLQQAVAHRAGLQQAAAHRAGLQQAAAHRAGLQQAAAHRAGLQQAAAHRAGLQQAAVDGRPWASMSVDPAHAPFPAVDAGRLRLGPDGLWVDPAGDGTFQQVLDAQALSGAFVMHENGQSYQPDPAASFVIEESGPVKTVLRRTGWYVEDSQWAGDSGQLAAGGSAAVSDPQRSTLDARVDAAHRAGLQEAATPASTHPNTHTPTHPHTSPFPTPDSRFCQYVTRMVIHHDSPVVRIFHTWIFTGDGNRDRIANMGWRFPTASAPEGGALLVSHDPATWSEASNLVQFDYQTFNLAEPGSDQAGRTPGVLSARVGEVGVHFGVKDFWQNFPSELSIDDDGFTFYNWPRHNPPPAFARPVPREAVFRHRFAHEGEVLDFRLPAEYAEGDIWREACALERHWAEGKPETANAQGIARTEEMFLIFTPASIDRDAVALTLQGLNDESLRAVVDPAWTAASGVFGDIHPRDTERFAEDEHLYEQVVLSPSRWNEQLGFYGMWLHGDLPAWAMNLPERFVSLYRTIRKNHHGWPIRWLAWARSGDPRLLKPAEAITRQMIDANFCHYVDEAVDASVGPDYFRLQGWWDRSLLPWAARRGPSTRTYTVDCDYLWQAYYLTGFTRARDVALLFGEATKNHFHAPTGPRTTASMLPSYLDMYEATWDPWFLLAAHTLARLHRHIRPGEALLDRFTDVTAHQVVADYWRPGDEQFTRFTGCPEHHRLTLNQSIAYSSPNTYGFRHRWDFMSFPYLTPAIFAWEATGDRFYLQRLAGYLDLMRRDIYDGEPDFYRGSLIQGGSIVSGYYIRQFPLALAALARAGEPWPTPIPDPFHVTGRQVPDADDSIYHFVLPEVIVRKESGVPLRIQLAHRFSSRADGIFYAYRVTDPSGNVLLEGAWPLDTQLRSVEIPADAPAGNYRIVYSGRAPLPDDGSARTRTIRNQGWVRLPATDPDVPEVLHFPGDENGIQVAAGRPELVYHFQVPRELESFWIGFGAGSRLNRVSVWNPDGERVWDHSFAGGPGVRGGRVDIDVPPEHAGGIWRASGGAFTIDPRIPPYFSQTRQKWFDPVSGTGDR